MKGLVVGVLLLVAASVCASQERGKNMLVLLDDLSMENSYSVFLGSLKDRGYSLHIQKADSDAIKFKEIGAFKYDSLLLFAPTTEEFGGSATVENILEFIDEGHDVILAASGDAAEPTREIAAAVGMELGSEGSYLIDHLNFDASDYDGEHTLVIANGFVDSPMILGKKKLNSVLFRGTAASLNPSNQLVFSVLSGSSSSYCLRPEGKIASTNDVHVAGIRSALVGGLQARNNARVAVSGSLELFSDAFINQKVKKSADDAGSASGNLQFITELSKWVLHERGLIRAIDIAYYHPDGREQTYFTVEDTITYTVTLQEWDGEKWIPFIADDVQIELDMLDPYIRTNVKHVKNGRYEVTFQVPDVYGVFNFNLDYYRVGYTSIHDRRICTVRPRRHDQYERFIRSAYPYYAGAFSMFVGAFLLSVVFLLHREK